MSRRRGAVCITGYVAAKQQHGYSPILKNATPTPGSTGRASASSALILVFAIVTNVAVNLEIHRRGRPLPVHRRRRLGGASLISVATAPPGLGSPDPGTFKGTIFLLSLVTCASMMPVEELPPASWPTALGLGFVSAVFDNIPLTALALKQGGYDWGFLAYAVGFGGSMIWFGSSAGVALSNMFPEAKSVGNWLRHGWHVALAYVVGFAVMAGRPRLAPGSTGAQRAAAPTRRLTAWLPAGSAAH